MPASDLLHLVLNGADLDQDGWNRLFAGFFDGLYPEPAVAGILAALRVRGEKAPELVAGASALRARAAKLRVSDHLRPLFDNCGTGGDGAHTFNISTAAAIVAAAGGVRIAKHGNRSVSSRCGSADLLFACGFPETLSTDAAVRLLEESGFTFFFAPNFHPAMKAVAPVRRALGIRTIFNLLGPLANPIAPEAQVIGVPEARYLRPMAEALQTLGVRSGLVVSSRDGLDELSPAAPSDACRIGEGRITDLVINPGDSGVTGSLVDLAGGDAAANRLLLEDLLAGRAAQGLTGAVALNAGAVFWIAGDTPGLTEGVAKALGLLRTGHARRFFADWLTKARTIATRAP